MAFIAIAPGPDGLPQTQGVVRAMADPDNTSAEFGIIIRSELKGGGLGQLLYVELSLFHHAQASTVIIAMLALSIAVDQASAWLRRRMR